MYATLQQKIDVVNRSLEQNLELEKRRAEEWRKKYEMSVAEFDRLLDAEQEKQRDAEQQLEELLAISKEDYQNLLTKAKSSENLKLRLQRALRIAEEKLKMRCELSFLLLCYLW